MYAFVCYKQKCKVVSLNLAHPVRSTIPIRFTAASFQVLRLSLEIGVSLSLVHGFGTVDQGC